MAQKKTAISVLLAPELASAVQERALLDGKTKTEIVSIALAEWLLQSTSQAGIDSISSALQESSESKLVKVINLHERALDKIRQEHSQVEQKRLDESPRTLNSAQLKLITASEAIGISESRMLKSATELVGYAKSIEVAGRKAIAEATTAINKPAQEVISKLQGTDKTAIELNRSILMVSRDFESKTLRDKIQFYAVVLIALMLFLYGHTLATGTHIGQIQIVGVAVVMLILFFLLDNPFRSSK